MPGSVIPLVRWVEIGNSVPNRWNYKSILRNFVKNSLTISPLSWQVYETVVAITALSLAYVLTPHSAVLHTNPVMYLAVVLASALASNVTGLHERRNLANKFNLVSNLLVSSLSSTLLFALFVNLVLFEHIGRWILVFYWLILFAGLATPKLLMAFAASNISVRILWVGSYDSAEQFSDFLAKHGRHYRLAGYWDGQLPAGFGKQDLDSMWSFYRSLDVDHIVLSKNAAEYGDVLGYCYKAAQAGCTIVDECTFMEDAFEQVPVEQINENWFFRSHITINGKFQDIAKRTVDIILSACVLTLGLPILGLIWLAIRLGGEKKVFFTQVRMGQFGVPFKMYKFRTMTFGTEVRAGWTKNRDIRITKVGRFLRRTRLDELPQFWNVLKGDMSVVGPRPEIPELVSVIEKDVPYFSFRCWAKPGITGMAQIRYRYCSDIADAREKLKYDLFYIKNWSILMDLQIILRTVTALMKGSR
ncbi:MAG: exopolysaccharide biosynthesis polyprenyl glycosylphosphotransferase [Sedimentisphaerales bacterium]|nr:exopolysaccharide biosynthesis polyprenyl glycosylphosphotransferase [Sedimentisphaerales bacterium]